eukprot:GFUD01036232.1.p1 GENE.GFUD01036232.1~~GFUD01036232.1.p1  ORF type:complete len:388 (+),score=109.05 GFUD01036232.1:1232-2395(+)
MKEVSFVIQLKKDLLDTICDDWGEKSLQLIRKHDKNLEKGDFSFPNLNNAKVWDKLNVKTDDLDKICQSCSKIEKIAISGDSSVVFLKRKSAFEDYFLNSNNSIKTTNSSPTIVNFDSSKPNSSILTSTRANSFHQALGNLDLAPSTVYGISSTDVKSLVDSFQVDPGLLKIGIRVGAVLGKNDKKDEETDFTTYKEKVYEAVKQLDEERCDENEDIKDAEMRLETLTAASIQFSFLGSNISNPVKMSTSNPNSNFVLYNSARIKKLVRTFDQHVKNGDYSPLPPRADIKFEVLTEIEEWELLFNFLLPYGDILTECARSLSFHKLVNFLVSLASTYSRYYNRVKTLKDPLPHLVPIIHARVCLIKEVNDIFDAGLGILNLKPLSRM